MSNRQGVEINVWHAGATRHLSGWLIAIATVIFLGCSTAPSGRGDLLDFLKDGVSTREEIFLQLGEPCAMYEGSRIMTYRLSRDEQGWVLRDTTKNWYGVFVNLVIVFDDQGVLKRHSLVQVRSQ